MGEAGDGGGAWELEKMSIQESHDRDSKDLQREIAATQSSLLPKSDRPLIRVQRRRKKEGVKDR